MASNIERLTIKDTFTNWRDKINLLIDVAVLAPMADEDGVMHIDIPHCNTRKVVFDVPVEFSGDVQAVSMECSESFVSSITATTIQETVDAGLKMTGTEGYIPWASGRTQNGTASLWTSTYDDSVHFSYVNLDGELVGTFSWDPESNLISAEVAEASEAKVARAAESLIVQNLSDTSIPGSYPIYFGPVDGENGSGSFDEGLTYNPRDGVLSSDTFKGNLDGNAKTATSAGKLSAKRRISLGTDASGYVDFDGSANVTLPCSLVATGVIPNLYGPSSNVNVPRTNRRFTVPSFRVDEKGRITQAFDRTVEFPFPEVDVDTSLNANSQNPIANSTITSKINEIKTILEETPGMETATESSPGLMSESDKIKLNSLSQYPRISSITAQTYNSANAVSATDTKNLSTAKTTKFTVNAKNGLNATLGISDTTSGSVMSLNLGMTLTDIAGSGLTTVNGKLVVPGYSGPTSSAAGTPGLVPSATNAQKNLFLNGAGQWAEPVGTTYSAATTSTAGLMSAADKTKLNGIAAQADNVTFSRSLSSGTKIGTININGTATDIYCEKNTDTTYAAFTGASASAAGKGGLVPVPAKGAQTKYLRGDATWQLVYDAAQMDTKLNAKANIASPAFTGTPTSPTPAAGDNTKKIATTAWVQTYCNTTKKYLTSHQSLASCVKTSGNQSIGGVKSFSDTIKSSAGDVICGAGNASMVRICSGTTAQNGGHLVLWGSTHSQYPGVFNLTAQKGSNAAARILSGKPDGTLEWKGNSVQVSSDERLKTAFGDVPDKVLDAWEKVQWGQYQFRDAKEEKGKNARLHLGLIAQRVKDVFEKQGLDACQYGILCYEEDEGYDGLWMVRYQEAEAMENICLRRRIDRLEKRLVELEKKK